MVLRRLRLPADAAVAVLATATLAMTSILAMSAALAVAVAAGATSPVRAQGAERGERSLTIYNIHTKETVTAVYKRNGRFVDAGLQQLGHVMRDHRRDEATKMDPELFDLLWQMHRELGSREPIHLISGYRSRATNDMLRRSVGGQASQSRHMLGKAADVHFPDVPVRQLRYSALIQERGGVGYYPTSALPFVHVDTDRVRSWPRLPRQELALLFPSGSTRHAPADGGPITPEDVRNARARGGDLLRHVAAFHDLRGGRRPAIAVADAGPPVPLPSRTILPAPPSLVEQPQLVSRPAAPPAAIAAVLAPSARDRARLAELASLAIATPRLIQGPEPARRPDRPLAVAALPSLTGHPLPAPPAPAATVAGPERQVASLGPAAPTLIDAGHLAAGWAPAPAYDDEHPDELSYRPFPVVPYLTDTAGEALLADLVAPDAARTLEVIAHPEIGATLRFRPTAQAVRALYAQQFTGAAVDLGALRDAVPTSGGLDALSSRAVRTSPR